MFDAAVACVEQDLSPQEVSIIVTRLAKSISKTLWKHSHIIRIVQGLVPLQIERTVYSSQATGYCCLIFYENRVIDIP